MTMRMPEGGGLKDGGHDTLVFPAGCIRIPLPPLQEIEFVKYKDAVGAVQTLDPREYIVDPCREPGLICPASGRCWPVAYPEINPVQVRFVAGYGAPADVPREVKQAILLKVASLYEHRGDEGANNSINNAVESLLWPDRVNLF